MRTLDDVDEKFFRALHLLQARVAIQQRGQHFGNEIHIQRGDALECLRRRFKIALLGLDMAKHDVGTHAFGLALESMIQMRLCLGEILRRARLLGLLAMELRDHRAFGFAADPLQPARMVDRLVPILFMLIDIDEVPQRRGHVCVHCHQIGEQGFGAIEQAGTHVVLAQFQQRNGFFFVAQVRTGDQVLVYADRAIDFAAAAEQVAERQMRLHRIAVELGQL